MGRWALRTARVLTHVRGRWCTTVMEKADKERSEHGGATKEFGGR